MTAAAYALPRRIVIGRIVGIALLAGLVLADYFTTQLLLQRSHVSVNPFLDRPAFVLSSGMVIRAICVAVIVVVAMQFPVHRRTSMSIVGAVVGWYGVVVVWNAYLGISLPG